MQHIAKLCIVAKTYATHLPFLYVVHSHTYWPTFACTRLFNLSLSWYNNCNAYSFSIFNTCQNYNNNEKNYPCCQDTNEITCSKHDLIVQNPDYSLIFEELSFCFWKINKWLKSCNLKVKSFSFYFVCLECQISVIS